MGVDLREFLEGLDHSVADEVVDRDVGIDPSFLQRLLGLLAESLDAAGVSAEHVCELGGVLERVVHRLSDKLAHVGHLLYSELLTFSGKILRVARLPCLEIGTLDHASDAGAGCRCLKTSGGHHGLGKAGLRRAFGGDHITLDDASVRAGAGHLGGVNAFLGGKPAGSWGNRRSSGRSGGSNFGSLGGRCGRLGGSRRRSRGLGGLRRSGSGSRRGIFRE